MLKELPSADGEGYAGLLKAALSPLIAIKTSSVCTAEKLVASTAAKDAGYTEINDESRKEAEARNVNNQRVLGVKAGTIALMEKLLGQEYVREITHNENGTQKSIDEISLAKLIKHITDSAQRQTWSEIRQQLVKFANHQFDFSKTISVNMVALQTIRERLQLRHRPFASCSCHARQHRRREPREARRPVYSRSPKVWPRLHPRPYS